MTWHLQNEDHAVNEKRIRRLMMPHSTNADLSKAQHQQAHEGAQDLSIPCGRAADRPSKSGLVRRHHLFADAQRLLVSCRNHGLVHPQGVGMAHLQHAGGRLLSRGAEPGHSHVRPARDHEYRPGLAVHILRLDRPVEAGNDQDLDGRQNPVTGQHLHRAAVTVPEV